jgi:hypothetical protein
MHSVWLFLAKFDCAGPLHNLFRHNVAPFVCFQQKKRVIGVHPSTIAKPADAAVRNELMYPALNMNAERVPRKSRSLMELSIGAVQQFDILGVRIPRRPRLSISYIGEDLLTRCVNNNFVMSKQVCLLWMKAFRLMYVLPALRSVSVESKRLVNRLRWCSLSAPHSKGS